MAERTGALLKDAMESGATERESSMVNYLFAYTNMQKYASQVKAEMESKGEYNPKTLEKAKLYRSQVQQYLERIPTLKDQNPLAEAPFSVQAAKVFEDHSAVLNKWAAGETSALPSMSPDTPSEGAVYDPSLEWFLPQGTAGRAALVAGSMAAIPAKRLAQKGAGKALSKLGLENVGKRVAQKQFGPTLGLEMPKAAKGAVSSLDELFAPPMKRAASGIKARKASDIEWQNILSDVRTPKAGSYRPPMMPESKPALAGLLPGPGVANPMTPAEIAAARANIASGPARYRDFDIIESLRSKPLSPLQTDAGS